MVVFPRQTDGTAGGAMILIRSEALHRIEEVAGPEPDSVPVAVSGQVFTYRGVNYLLCTAWRIDDVAAAPPQPAPAPEAVPAPPAPRASDLDAVMRELEEQRRRPRSLAAPGDGMNGRGDPAVLPEGTMLVRRRGRLVRVAEGQTALLIDNDADSSRSADPLLLLAPCRALEQMEQMALVQGETLLFEVSGRVLAYRGRNYMIPILFQLCPPSELERRQ